MPDGPYERNDDQPITRADDSRRECFADELRRQLDGVAADCLVA